MQLDKYTNRTRGFIQVAQTTAQRMSHQQLEPEHFAKVLLEDSEGQAANLLEAAVKDIDLKLVKKYIMDELEKMPKVEGAGAGQVYVSKRTSEMFHEAESQAKKYGDDFVTTEIILLALTTVKSEVASILREVGVTPQKLLNAIKDMRKGRKASSAGAEKSYDALKKYAIDITERAAEGNIDPVIGREEEIRRTVQVLARRTKNNAVLIGEPGVGKTAIVEGLALRIVNGDVPESLKGTKLMALDLGALIAGAEFRGEFEDRLKGVLQEIQAEAGQIILFIDEMHTLVGAGKAEGSMDASNMLKPALARGELHCIGATTIDEYRKYIEKDPALARRFQPVFVSEPSVEETISILRGLKEKYEVHHGVRITDSAIVSAATLSNRYITDRFLPDKAIDLIDEASARLRMQVDSKPDELDELDRKIIQMKIEREALKNETDKATKDRLQKLEKELEVLEGQSEEKTKKWQQDKKRLNKAQELKEQLDNARHALEIAQRNGDLEKAGEIAYSFIPALEKEIEKAEASQDTAATMQEEVKSQDIAAVVSRWTGIPVDKMLEAEREKLLHMEDALHGRVVGQDEAISAISNAIRRARAGLQDPNRPMGSFIFLGPTGVGKTELTKALAEFLFDDETAMVRLDMSEYMEKHSVARLIGAPPGYVGYESGGALTEAVRRRPYQVVLFDEIEKAHLDVFNVLLQVLDDGRLTDGQGRTVDFKNTLIIMTSNLGAEHLVNLKPDQDVEEVRGKVMDAMRNTFRPEFLNRIDDILLFQRLSREQMDHIVGIQLHRLESLLEDQNIAIELSKEAATWLADKGYDPAYGARPLKRVVQQNIQNPLAEMILRNEVKEGQTVKVGVKSGKLVLTATAKAAKKAAA